MTSNSVGANLPRANPSAIENFITYKPPISLQTQFAQIVEKTEQAKEKMKAQLAEMDNNFNGLMANVFKSN